MFIQKQKNLKKNCATNGIHRFHYFYLVGIIFNHRHYYYHYIMFDQARMENVRENVRIPMRKKDRERLSESEASDKGKVCLQMNIRMHEG